MVNSLSNKGTSTAFKLITSNLTRDDLTDILFNWNESELSADGERIIKYVGRDRQYSRGSEGGKALIDTKEFIAWLFSDAPFAETIYGSNIKSDIEWRRQIGLARIASGLHDTELSD